MQEQAGVAGSVTAKLDQQCANKQRSNARTYSASVNAEQTVACRLTAMCAGIELGEDAACDVDYQQHACKVDMYCIHAPVTRSVHRYTAVPRLENASQSIFIKHSISSQHPDLCNKRIQLRTVVLKPDSV